MGGGCGADAPYCAIHAWTKRVLTCAHAAHSTRARHTPHTTRAAQATWKEAHGICTSSNTALPIIRTPRHNSDLQRLLREAARSQTQPQPQPSAPTAAWIGLTDSEGVPVVVDGGGWQYVGPTLPPPTPPHPV